MRLDRPNPASRLGLEVHKKKNSIVLEPRPADILPPSSSHGKQRPFTRAKTVPSRALDKVSDMDFISEDFTPPSRAERSNDWIDFSVVIGDESGNFNFPGGENAECLPVEQAKMAKKKTDKPRAPEQRITMFAFRLAMVEKAASMMGTLAFLWATVVLLGGFASDIPITDFWVVTTIIVAEGARIFNRSHELEWQRLSSKSTGMGARFLNSFKSSNSSVYSRLRKHLRPRRRKSGSKLEVESSSTTGSSTRPASSSTKPAPATPELVLPQVRYSLQQRTWSKLTLPVFPYTNFITTEDISSLLYLLQLFSASVCIGLPIWRLTQTNKEIGRIPDDEMSDEQKSRVLLSLNLFYAVSICEAGLFVLEKCYWEYKFRISKILDEVVKEANLRKDENLELVKQFYYDVYAECLRNSVFDGLEMDLVSYGISWLQSEDPTQQLAGAKLLNRLVSVGNKQSHTRSAVDTLRRIGTTPDILERLVEMLSWDSRQERGLLSEIATIVCRLVGFNRNCSRIVAIPGSMDGVVSLLLTYNSYSPEEQKNKEIPYTPPLQLWLTGLVILKHLCKDTKNSLKIGETPRLLAILVTFIEVRDDSSFDATTYYGPAHFKNRMKTYKKSLQVLSLLAAATNTSGQRLRRRIAGVVSGLKNLRDVIQYGSEQPELQGLAVDILFNLSLESDVKQRIGATGGALRNLFGLFAQYDSYTESQSPPGIVEPRSEQKVRQERLHAAVRSGQALTRLAVQQGNPSRSRDPVTLKAFLESVDGFQLNPDVTKNFLSSDEEGQRQVARRMLKLRDSASQKTFLEVMVDSLLKPAIVASSAAKILRSLMPIASEEEQREVARRSAPLVVDIIMNRLGTSKSEIYEACLGLGSRIIGPLDTSIHKDMLSKVDRVKFVTQLMKNLFHTPTTNKFPRIRRYSVEVILALIEKDDSFMDAFQRTNIDLKEKLEMTLDSISEVENFCLFSGLAGYIRYDTEMEDLVLRAIAAVDGYNARSQSGQHS